MMATAMIIILCLLAIIMTTLYLLPKRKHTHKKTLNLGEWILYVNSKCPFCKKQLQLLNSTGNSSSLSIINCDDPNNPNECANVVGVPMWLNKVTKEQKSGYQDYRSLTQMAQD